MDSVWGIPWQVFLAAYGIAFVVLVRRVVIARGAGASRKSTMNKLSCYNVAYLLGGIERVVATGIARLLHDGQLRTTRLGGLVAVENATAVDAVTSAVLRAAPTHSPATVASLSTRVINRKELAPLADKLIASGLCNGSIDRTRSKTAEMHLLALVVFGIIAQPWLSSILVRVLLVTACVIVLTKIPMPRLTRTGKQLAADIKAGRVEVADLAHPAAGPVALHGFSHYPDASKRFFAEHFRGAPAPISRRRRTGSCSSSSSSGGGCSSSSCSSSSGSSCSSSSDSGSSSSSCGGGGGGCGGGGGGD